MRNSKALALILAIASSLALVGCASEISSSQSDKSDIESITLYSGRSEALIAPLIAQFTIETGIKVSVRYGDSAEMSATILEEGTNSPADVFLSQDAGALGALTQAGLFKTLPNQLLDQVDPAFRANDGTWIGVSGRARAFTYNPNLVMNVPISVLELANPEWKNRIAIAPTNASFQSFITGMRASIGAEATLKFLTGLASNAKAFEKNGQILDAVESGEIAAGLINHYYWYEKANEVGIDSMKSKLSWFESGDTGNLINVAGVGVISDNPAAVEFANWLLSKTAQNYFLDETFEYPLTQDAKPVESLPKLTEIGSPVIDLSDLSSLGETQELLRRVGLIP